MTLSGNRVVPSGVGHAAGLQRMEEEDAEEHPAVSPAKTHPPKTSQCTGGDPGAYLVARQARKHPAKAGIGLCRTAWTPQGASPPTTSGKPVPRRALRLRSESSGAAPRPCCHRQPIRSAAPGTDAGILGKERPSFWPFLPEKENSPGVGTERTREEEKEKSLETSSGVWLTSQADRLRCRCSST